LSTGRLVRFVDQGLGDFARDTWQADVEACAEKVAAVAHVQVHFGVNRELGGQGGRAISTNDSNQLSASCSSSASMGLGLATKWQPLNGNVSGQAPKRFPVAA
jgi:hypothetical protein